MSAGPFVALHMVCWCVELLCLSITFWAHFQGIYGGCQQRDRCVSVCVRACSLINKTQGRPSLSHLWFSEDDDKVLGIHTYTRTLCLLENRIQIPSQGCVWTSHTQTFHSPFSSIILFYYIVGLYFWIFLVGALCHNATEMAKLIAEMWEHSNIATRKSDSGRRHKQSDEL